MADIILDDLMRWESGRLRPANDLDAGLRSRPLSWAVTIRPTAPVMPHVRGDELVVVPSNVLDELREMEDVGWDDLVDLLEIRPVSAILTDNGRQPPPGIPVLLADASFVRGAEAELNREVTERRATLYRLGSALSRALTSASMAGAGLDQFLNAAEAVSGVPLALLTASGTPLAHSHSFPSGIDIDPEAAGSEAAAESERVETAHGDWLLAAVESEALPPGVVLAAGIESGASGERARLVLREVSQALGLLFDRLPPLAAPTVERERERFIHELLTGRADAGQRRWRRLLSALAPESPLRIALTVAPGSQVSLRSPKPPLYHATLDDDRSVLIFPDGLAGDVLARARRGELPPLVISQPLGARSEIPSAFKRVGAAAKLVVEGLLEGPVVDLGDPLTGGVPGLILALAEPRDPDAPASRALNAYADTMLAALDEYDAERGGSLVDSLAAYLRAGTSVSLAAERLGVHRNTLAYRLTRIHEITGYDLDNPQVRLSLHLAVSVRSALEALFGERNRQSP